MYRLLLRPLLFLFQPETIHKWSIYIVKIITGLPIISLVFQKCYLIRSDHLEKKVFGLNFPNPVGLAAGFDKDASFYKEFSVFGFGFIEIGTVTPQLQEGNLSPRSFRLPKDKALINRMGFNNLGVDQAVRRLRDRSDKLIIGGNIGKNTLTPEDKAVDDYAYCFRLLYDVVDYFVINVSCPNIGDISKLQDQETLEIILGRLSQLRMEKTLYKPILLKISPDLNFKQIDETISIIQRIGIDGIVAVNTTITREGLITSESRVKAIGKGGLSGAPLREKSNAIIRYIKEKTEGRLPVIGSGGVMTVKDAIEKLEAGADLIQVYTGFVYEGPGFVKKILKALIRVNSKKST